jgi:hypothetical protein
MAEAEGKGKPQGEGNAEGKAEGKGKKFVALALAIVAGIVASVGLLAVISAGFALSFDAISAVAIAAHIAADKAWMMPVSIDGAMLVASVHFVIARRQGGKGFYPLTVVIVGTLISIACNGLHATGDKGRDLDLGGSERFLVSTVPALMLALSVHMLVELLVQLVGKPAHATHATHATPDEQVGQYEAGLVRVAHVPLLPEPALLPSPSQALPSPPLAPPAPPSAPEPEGKPAARVRATVAARAPGATVTARATGVAPDELAVQRAKHDLALVRELALGLGKVPGRAAVKSAIHGNSDRADAAIRSLRAEIDAGAFVITATTQESAQ